MYNACQPKRAHGRHDECDNMYTTDVMEYATGKRDQPPTANHIPYKMGRFHSTLQSNRCRICIFQLIQIEYRRIANWMHAAGE